MTALSKYELLEAPGQYFDGETARPRDVVVKFGDASLIVMNHGDMPITHWSLAGLRDITEAGEGMTLCPDFDADERLTVFDPDMTAAIRAVCPNLTQTRPVAASRWRKIAAWTTAALGAVYLIIFHLVPALSDQMATLIPAEAEVSMGQQMSRQFAQIISEGDEPRFCADPEGLAALNVMVERLDGASYAHVPLTIRVLDHDMINAFALPGGQIMLFKGLLRKAESPEEVAGVLAHEVGHVVARDPTRLTLRSAGTAGILGLLLGDFTGATVTVALSEALLRSGYQRDAETAADDFATKVFADRELPTGPFAGFFVKLKEEHGGTSGLLSHLSTHPDLDGRAAKTRAADTIGDAPFEPVLTDQQWVALQNICKE